MDLATASDAPPIVHISGEAKSVRDLAEDVMREHGISLDQAATMFPPSEEPANYLISKTKGGS